MSHDVKLHELGAILVWLASWLSGAAAFIYALIKPGKNTWCVVLPVVLGLFAFLLIRINPRPHTNWNDIVVYVLIIPVGLSLVTWLIHQRKQLK